MPCINTFTGIAVIALMISSICRLIFTAHHHKEYYALAYLPFVIMGNIYASFAIKSIVNSIIMLFVPIRIFKNNSVYYSCISTIDNNIDYDELYLPKFMIQVPVYLESFNDVIKPTLENAMEAIEYYKSKGGHAKICVCDDGLQVQYDQIKVDYYKEKGIGYIARPKENRPGRFKKAGNLNFCTKVSGEFNELINNDLSCDKAWQSIQNNNILGGGDIGLCDESIILLIDSDTYIPKESLYIVAPEFNKCEDLAYIQHSMKAFEYQNRNLWEKMINNFTNRIYNSGLKFGTAMGDMCPIVGHNVFIRYSSLLDILQEYKIIWSEDKVSEDFDLFIRFSSLKKLGRYGTYCGDFQEGISLTYNDELNKLTKFSYGACEIIINPWKDIFSKGFFNKTFWSFVKCSNIPIYSKLSTVYYLLTYFALASAFYFILFESIITILKPSLYERYLFRSIDIMFACLITFAGIPLVTETILKWRLNRKFPYHDFFQQALWILPHGLFLVSIMFHTTVVTFCYVFGIPVSWGATPKDNNKITFFYAIRKTILDFYLMFIVMTPLTIGYLYAVIYFSMGIYRAWGMLFYGFCHIFMPFLLNPNIIKI